MNDNALLVNAAKDIIKAFTNFRKGTRKNGMPKSESQVTNFFNELKSIKEKYQINIDNQKLINCYYSYLEYNLENKRINYDLFIDTIIKLKIIEEVN